MARATVIPPPSPQRTTRITRARTRVTTESAETNFDSATTKSKTRSAEPVKRGRKTGTKTAKTDEPKKRSGRKPAESHPDIEETDDEIGLEAVKAKKTAAPTKGRSRPLKSSISSMAFPEGASEDDDDELAQSDVPQRKAGKPKAKPVAKPSETTKPTKDQPKVTIPSSIENEMTIQTITKKPRGRPAGRTAAQPKPSAATVPTTSSLAQSKLMGEPPKRKKVTFADISDSEQESVSAPSAARGKKAISTPTVSQTGFRVKPVRKAETTAGRGRPPKAAQSSAKPLSPKKATQIAKSNSSASSEDAEEDELSGEKTIILVVRSPTKSTSEHTGLSSPVKRINFNGSTPSRPAMHKGNDENIISSIQPSSALRSASFMGSSARRLPGTPREALRDTPRRGLLFTGEQSISKLESTPMKMSPLKASPKKGKLAASFTASPFKSSTPFDAKMSLLQSPAKRIQSPFVFKMMGSSVKKHSEATVEKDVNMDMQADVACNFQATNSPGKVYKPSDEELSMEEAKAATQGHEIDGDDVFTDFPAVMTSTKNGEDLQASDDDDEMAGGMTEGKLEEDEFYTNSAAAITWENEVEEIIQNPVEDEQILEEDLLNAMIFQHDVDVLNHTDDDEKVAEENILGKEQTVEEDHTTDEEENVVCSEGENPTLIEAQIDDQDIEQSRVEEREGQNDNDIIDAPINEQEEFHEDVQRLNAKEHHDNESVDEQDNLAPSNDNALQAYNGCTEAATENAEEFVIFADQEDETESVNSGDQHCEGLCSPVLSYNGRLSPDVGSPVSPYEISESGELAGPIRRLSIPPAAPSPPSLSSVRFIYRDDADDENSDDELNDDGSPRRQTSGSHSIFIETPSASIRQQTSQKSLAFTPLVAQLSQWKASSPEKSHRRRSQHRSIFSPVVPASLAMRPAAGPLRVMRHSLFRQSLLSSSVNQDDLNDEEKVVEMTDEIETKTQEVESSNTQEASASQELLSDDDAEDRLADTEDGKEQYGDENAVTEENVPSNDVIPADDPKGNTNNQKNHHLSMSITPVRINRDAQRTIHTIAKVPLKPEGEISPVKNPRKRPRSLSFDLPIPTRNSPRLNVMPKSQTMPALSLGKQPDALNVVNQDNNLSDSDAEDSVKLRPSSTVATPAKASRRNINADEQVLRGAVVFVDVHTTEGEDASGIFVELLTQMGAKCIKSWSWNPRASLSPVGGVDIKESKVGITHVVFKDGGVRSLEKVRQAGELVKCVGVGWVLDCERENKWVDETHYLVDSSMIPRGGAKRRKSMQPRALANVNGSLTSSINSRRSRAPADWNTMEEFMKLSTDTPPSASGESAQKHIEDPPKTPGQGDNHYEFNFNFDFSAMSPATPYYLSQGAKLIQQTCPPKQTQRGLFFPLSGKLEDEPDVNLRAKLEAARRKSMVFKPKVGSPLTR